MKKLTCLIMVCTMMGLHGQPVSAPADEPGFQLTVELRDGSRVVGQTLEDTLSFHSATLGDMKLSWASIRTIEYAADTGTAHLTASNGDGLTVQLSGDSLGLETGFGKTELPVKLIQSIKVSPPAKPNVSAATGATKEADLRLTIELRDGSHLVGKGLDDTLNFHSTAMGDLKLTWAGIRSIEYATTGTDSAQLTATNGDVYEVQFAAPTVGVETSFGKTELPVKLIRSIRVWTAGNGGEHLVGWWKLDDGTGTVAKDSSSSQPPHDGTLTNGPVWTQSPGRNEMSLQFNGGNQYVSLGNILQGSYTEISIACWVRHSGTGPQTIVCRSVSDNSDGIGMGVSDFVEFGHYGIFVRSKESIQDGQWHHLAGTMSPSESGSGYLYSLYLDGKLDNTATFPMGLTATSNGWGIGARYDGAWAYQGLIGDVRIYDHALSAAEVDALYEEQSNGEPPALPSPAPPAPPFSPSVHRQDEAVFGGKMKPGSIGGATD